jgi:hypothetical protein
MRVPILVEGVTFTQGVSKSGRAWIRADVDTAGGDTLKVFVNGGNAEVLTGLECGDTLMVTLRSNGHDVAAYVNAPVGDVIAGKALEEAIKALPPRWTPEEPWAPKEPSAPKKPSPALPTV